MKFKEMNIYSKILYVLGIVNFIEAIAGIIYAIFTFFKVTSIVDTLKTRMLSYPNIFTLDKATKYSAIVLFISWLVVLLISLLEIRAAKDNTKILLPFIFVTINFVLEIIEIFTNGFSISVIFSTLSFIVCLIILLNNKRNT